MKLKCYKSLKYTAANKGELKIDTLWILVTFIINVLRHIANSRLSYMHMLYIYIWYSFITFIRYKCIM